MNMIRSCSLLAGILIGLCAGEALWATPVISPQTSSWTDEVSLAFESLPLWSQKKKKAGATEHFRGGRTKRAAHRPVQPVVEPTKTMRSMNFAELAKRKQELLSFGDKFTAMKYVEKMIPLCDDLELKGELILELADLNFDCGYPKVAEARYKEFADLYPGAAKTEYALYKAITTSFAQTLAIDRDQTKTHDTLKLIDDFFARHSVFTNYDKQVEIVKRQCWEKLFESELYVAQFYISIRNNSIAAQKRIAMIEEKYLDLLPEASARVAQLKADFAQQFPAQLTPTLAPVATGDGAAAPVTQVAQAQQSKSMVDRF